MMILFIKKYIFGILFLVPIFMIAQDSHISIYDYKVTDIEGNDFSFETLRGKKIMIVNTASKCGYTPQFEQLEKIYNTYKGSGFIVVGFPSNDFLFQDPGTNEEIAQFCKRNYGVTFPMMAKVKVRGKDKHSMFRYLTEKTLNGIDNSKVSWNFNKFLIDRNGHFIKHYGSKIKPDAPEIIQWITSEN